MLMETPAPASDFSSNLSGTNRSYGLRLSAARKGTCLIGLPTMDNGCRTDRCESPTARVPNDAHVEAVLGPSSQVMYHSRALSRAAKLSPMTFMSAVLRARSAVPGLQLMLTDVCLVRIWRTVVSLTSHVIGVDSCRHHAMRAQKLRPCHSTRPCSNTDPLRLCFSCRRKTIVCRQRFSISSANVP